MNRKKYYSNEAHSDVEVRFGERRIPAHKIILASGSNYFDTAFASGFPVATGDVIDLGFEDNPDAVECMLRWMYDIIDDRLKPPGTNFGWLMFLIDAFEVADKYDVPRFVDWIAMELNRRCTINDDFILGVQRVCGPLANQLGDRSLQNAMMAQCAKHISKLETMELFVELNEKGELFSPSLSARLLHELHAPAREDGRSRNFFSAEDIIDRCYITLPTKEPMLIHAHYMDSDVKDGIRCLIKRHMMPRSEAELSKHLDTVPPGIRIECVWTRLEGKTQSTNDEIYTCNRCSEEG